MAENKSCAFFDLDYTILDCDSFRLFLRYVYVKNWKGRFSIPRLVFWGVMRKIRLISLCSFKGKSLSIVLKGLNIVEVKAIGHDFFQDCLAKHIRSAARQRIQKHRIKGHIIIIVTGSPDVYLESIKDSLDVDDYTCTRLLYEEGIFSGRIDGDDCLGPHKVIRIQNILDDLGVSPDHCYSYSDDISDSPMMEMVGTSIAVNPSPPLRQLAQKVGWDIQVW